jgi:hypothetical protein
MYAQLNSVTRWHNIISAETQTRNLCVLFSCISLATTIYFLYYFIIILHFYITQIRYNTAFMANLCRR